jgi:hypothetical protein
VTSSESVQIDPKVRIVELLYGEFFKSNIAGLAIQNFMMTLDIPENKLYPELEILESNWFIQKNQINRYVITVSGINKYEELIPPSEITRKQQERKLILEVLLPLYTEQHVYDFMTSDELANRTKLTDRLYLLATVEYLSQSGLVYLEVANGGAFWIRLTSEGYQSLQDKITNNLTVMVGAYKILFNLENHLRQYIESKMRNALGTDWWEKGVSGGVREKAGKRKAAESNTGWNISLTNGESDYFLFEDLSKIIISNWDNVFKEDLHDQSKIILKLTELEIIRHAIAHTRMLTLEGLTRLQQYSNELLALTGEK